MTKRHQLGDYDSISDERPLPLSEDFVRTSFEAEQVANPGRRNLEEYRDWMNRFMSQDHAHHWIRRNGKRISLEESDRIVEELGLPPRPQRSLEQQRLDDLFYMSIIEEELLLLSNNFQEVNLRREITERWYQRSGHLQRKLDRKTILWFEEVKNPLFKERGLLLAGAWYHLECEVPNWVREAQGLITNPGSADTLTLATGPLHNHMNQHLVSPKRTTTTREPIKEVRNKRKKSMRCTRPSACHRG